MTKFLVVNCPTIYNVILERPILDDLNAVTSVRYQTMIFLTTGGVAMIKSCTKESQECYNRAINATQNWLHTRTMIIAESKPNPRPLEDIIDPRVHIEEPVTRPIEELREIRVIEEDSTCVLKVGSGLSGKVADNMESFLKKNLDVFAWVHADMVGISPELMCHRLNLNPKAWPIRQKIISMDAEHSKALKDEVDKLLNINFIKEVKYPDWLANPLVDATDENALLSFMDAYSGYNQIPMYQPDEEHTSFITNRRIYCYRVMSFGLKNAGAIYQHLVNKMFADQIGKIMEV
ncbi:uncharacterized protein LOC116116470 [Pistacia vera]|uniref:uncharacterized protein LOC116116470 n=1 Tax=Pistacia vera TaxID=55513 RepID=UPI0012636A29|nr:uncharacterized protein LOC116116470 [Pistacia vera]